MSLSRLDGNWRDGERGDVDIFDGTASLSSPQGPRPMQAPLKASGERLYAGRWHDPNDGSEGHLSLLLSDDWCLLEGELSSARATTSLRLARTSFVSYDQPVPARWPIARHFIAAMDELAIHARLGLTHDGRAVVVHPYQWLGDRMVGLELLNDGAQAGYRKSPMAGAVPAIVLRRQGWADNAKLALRMTTELTSGIASLDDVAFIRGDHPDDAIVALRQPGVAEALVDLFRLGASRIALHHDPLVPSIAVALTSPPAECLDGGLAERGLVALSRLAQTLQL
jgi:hypothetical protein